VFFFFSRFFFPCLSLVNVAPHSSISKKGISLIISASLRLFLPSWILLFFLITGLSLVNELILQEPIPIRLTASSWHALLFLMIMELLKNVAIHHRGLEGECKGFAWRAQSAPSEPTSSLWVFSNISSGTGKCFWQVPFSHTVADSESFQNTLIKLMLVRDHWN